MSPRPLLLLLLTLVALPAGASLYRGAAPRPGPDILYAPLADAPQLQNVAPWRAAPILVSGASAYRRGEFIYQDYLYDDHGARQVPDPQDPMLLALAKLLDPNAVGLPDNSAFALPNGTYTYPDDDVYAANAADLVELRVRATSLDTYFRVTLNTLVDPDRVGFTIALGGDTGVDVAWPHGANVVAPGEVFLTVHGFTATLHRADGTRVRATIPVTIDLQRRQFTVRLRRTAWAPSGDIVRIAAGVGLWDNAADAYLLPLPTRTATRPGGAGLDILDPAAFFNVAFRYSAQEPFQIVQGVAGAGAFLDPAWWRDSAQGAALARGDIGDFYAEIDFRKLLAGATDELLDQPRGTPTSGPMNRIYASHFETKQGVDYRQSCSSSTACFGALRGRLQPYAIYVPPGAPPAGGWGLTLLLHSLAANYNQFSGSRHQRQFAQRGLGSIVITAAGRGPDGWYYDHAGADTFEMWADVAARYRLDVTDTVIAGYSMGGYASFKFAAQYPDLFAKAQPTVGPPALGIWFPPFDPLPGGARSNTVNMLASLRHIPVLGWYGALDELVPLTSAQAQFDALAALGYRYQFNTHLTAEHLMLAINDQYQPAADFLGEVRVNVNPAHVSYVVNPTMDFPAVGTVADHAYWLSGLRLRSTAGAAPLGRIEAFSEGFGTGDAPATGVRTGAGTLDGGALGPLPWTSQSQDWGRTPRIAVADRLRITATNIATVTVNPVRARLSCNAEVVVESDGPVQVILAGC